MERQDVFGVSVVVVLLSMVTTIGVATSPVLGTSESDLFFLDTHETPGDGAAGPGFSDVPLRQGWLYDVTVQGTFSLWAAEAWGGGHCGEPEKAPAISSSGVSNGKVGADAELVFAAPQFSIFCQQELPHRHSLFEISLDGGSTWLDLTPVRGTLATHSYTYLVVGQEAPLGVRLLDDRTSDNYGVLSIEIRELGKSVGIDIQPGSSPNSVNPSSQGTTPVAILSTNGFSAPEVVDRESLAFGRTGGEESLRFCSGAEDVNDDGLLDLVCHFETAKTGLLGDEEAAILTGATEDNQPLAGSDSVRIVPPPHASEPPGADGRVADFQRFLLSLIRHAPVHLAG